MRIHIIMHESFEAPTAIENWANNRNHQITYTCLFDGETFPKIVEDISSLVVMGGPQSPSTTSEQCS